MQCLLDSVDLECPNGYRIVKIDYPKLHDRYWHLRKKGSTHKNYLEAIIANGSESPTLVAILERYWELPDIVKKGTWFYKTNGGQWAMSLNSWKPALTSCSPSSPFNNKKKSGWYHTCGQEVGMYLNITMPEDWPIEECCFQKS